MTNPETSTPQAAVPPQPEMAELSFQFTRTPAFRVIHAEGAWLTMSPALPFFHLYFYNDRLPIPESITAQIDKNGSMIAEVENKRIAFKGMARELEVDVVMSIEALEHFHAVVGINIREFRKMQAQQQAQKVK